MTAVMAAETPRRIVVSGIVGMTAPGHLQVWKNIAQIDRRNRLGRLLDQSPKALRPVALLACCRSRHRFWDERLMGNTHAKPKASQVIEETAPVSAR